MINEVKNICGIKIQGRNFDELTPLNIFKNKNNTSRVSLIYGENGSGKTTISRAFLKIKGKDDTGIIQANLFDTNDRNIDINNANNLFVFNEDFINENIKVKQKGLSAIVILGEQNRIDDKIKKIEEEEAPLNEEIKKIEETKISFNNTKSPRIILNKINDVLRGSSSWSERDSKIKGKRQNTAVNDRTHENFKNVIPTKPKDQLIRDFYNLLDEKNNIFKLNEISLDGEISKLQVLESHILTLLNKKIENPKLTDREKKLVSIITSSNSNISLNKIKLYFEHNKQNYCPLCFQPVSDSYRENLVLSIQNILGEEVKEHQKELSESFINKIEIDFKEYKEIDNVNDCENALKELNESIEQINKQIQDKINNPYIPIKIENYNLSHKKDCLIDEIQVLNKNVRNFNQKLQDTKSLNKKLEKINAEIAHIDTAKYEKLLEESKKDEARIKEKIQYLLQKNKEIENTLVNLKEKKKNVNIALDKINAGLKYIFFSQSRLELKFENDQYVLYSRGKPVQPSDISVGERNIIALCYFFTSILKNKDTNAIKNPYLIIIDDPISSFDMENKVGIVSYLKYKLSQFLCENNDTKIMLLTHDLQVLSDLRSVIVEILGKGKKNCRIFHLFNNKLIDKDGKQVDKNEYSRILKNIFLFADESGSEENDMEIGNEMRKALEAYGTFTYKKGISQISCDDEVIEKLRQPHRLYFKNLMYRLVLHGESHMEDRVNNLEDINFYQFISEDEKRRTAKDIICFLYELDSVHVITHLNENKNNKEEIKKTIEKWCDEIPAI